jgi:uncharacterized membrane protein (DUF4010 family)
MPDVLVSEESALQILRVTIALALGFLIGFERGWKQREQPAGERIAGVRTYGMFGLLGGLAGVAPGDWMLPAAVLGACALIAVGYFLSAQERDADRGMTSEASALATVIVGGLAGRGEVMLAAAGAVLILLLLSLKTQLHQLLQLVRHEEILAALRLLVLSVLVLPFLPNQGFGPGDVLNPSEIWWSVLLVASLSFAGYIAVRSFGARNGPLAFRLLGGLASSTAVSAVSARMAKGDDGMAAVLSGTIGLASTVMMGRTALLALAVAPSLFVAVAPALAAAAATSLIASLLVVIAGRGSASVIEGFSMKTPDDIWFAVTFGGMLATISLGAFFARQYFGDAGLFALAAISGPFDVDAFSLSVARSIGGGAANDSAAAAVLLCVAINTLGKLVIAALMGSAPLALRVGAVVAASLAAGIVTWALL